MIKTAIEQVMKRDMADIWTILRPGERRRIIDSFEIIQIDRNQVIYPEGQKPSHLWTLLEGGVKKFKAGVGGREQILRLIKPVQYFGYRAYFAGEDYVSAAATIEQSVLGKLPMELVVEMIKSNEKVAMFFIHELSRNLGNSDTKIVSLTQKHIRGRLAEALCVLIDTYGFEADGLTIPICLSREELANLSNMTTANAIRTLSGFVTEKLLIVDGRKIKVIDQPTLRAIGAKG